MESEKNCIAEILCIHLKHGSGAAFNKLYIEQSLPLQKKWKVDVLAFGPSLHDEDSYLVVRRYKDLADREQSQDLFYGSDEWKLGPRESILSLIEHSVYVVIPANDTIIAALEMINHLKEHEEK